MDLVQFSLLAHLLQTENPCQSEESLNFLVQGLAFAPRLTAKRRRGRDTAAELSPRSLIYQAPNDKLTALERLPFHKVIATSTIQETLISEANY